MLGLMESDGRKSAQFNKLWTEPPNTGPEIRICKEFLWSISSF